MERPRRPGPQGDAVTSLTKKQRQEAIIAGGGICWLCNLPVRRPTIDHVIPSAVFRVTGPYPYGVNNPINLRIAHGRCNSYRGCRMDIDTVRRELAAALARKNDGENT